jgi:hypothetical protein
MGGLAVMQGGDGSAYEGCRVPEEDAGVDAWKGDDFVDVAMLEESLGESCWKEETPDQG